jgi:hypothetical protein
VASNPGLCLDVQWANPASGTPVWIWGCNGGSAQQWVYDRSAQTVVNPAFGKCLQARPVVLTIPGIPPFFPSQTFTLDNRSPGVQAEISDCISPPPLRQQWTYDPEGGTLRSALGTVLDIQWNDQQAGTLTWLWDYNGGAAQQWRADHSSTYCSNLCLPGCQTGCAGAGPGTGACVGSCMGGCVGNCMSSWP